MQTQKISNINFNLFSNTLNKSLILVKAINENNTEISLNINDINFLNKNLICIPIIIKKMELNNILNQVQETLKSPVKLSAIAAISGVTLLLIKKRFSKIHPDDQILLQNESEELRQKVF